MVSRSYGTIKHMEFKEYTGVTRATIDRWRQDAARHGTALPEGDRFTLSKSGVTISADYNEPAQTLKLSIDDKPAFLPPNLIWSIIESTLRSGQ